MSVFYDLDYQITSLSYITSTQKKILQKAGLHTVGDILANIPLEYEQRHDTISLHQAPAHKKALVQVEVISHDYIMLKRKGRLLIVTISDNNTFAQLHCYGRDFLKNTLRIASKIYIWGSFLYQRQGIVSSSFEVITNINTSSARLGIIPRYRVPLGFSQITYYKLINKILSNIIIPELHHYVAEIEDHSLIDRAQAITSIHAPISMEALTQAQKRLAFDEILLFQLSLKTISNTSKYIRSKLRTQCTGYTQAITQCLPFTLTQGQTQIIHTLQKQLWGEVPMNTLMQGDVGSGKTLVALFCALSVIEAGEQVVFAVPSESLAFQHYQRISKLFTPLNINCTLLTGSIKKTEKVKLLSDLSAGTIQLIVGTHALYSQDVKYHHLGLIIIDEQHRFGVSQRATLIEKGTHESHRPDVLLMSATPIPRSLALTIYGNLNIVSLKDRPAIQQPVLTRLIQYERRKEVYKKILSNLEKQEQAFLIFPQIEIDVSSTNSLALSIETLFPEIAHALQPHRCEMLHSKMPDEEKIKLMSEFENGHIAVLVATTIIEVGIDVPNATTIGIFNAERFGLSTLHQLRGRVGRGTLVSEAILIFRSPLNETAKERLKILYEESDGFVISERDMQLRGPGDIHQLGLRQSGALLFQFTDAFYSVGPHILQQTLDISKKIVKEDPTLSSRQHSQLRKILYKKVGTL